MTGGLQESLVPLRTHDGLDLYVRRWEDPAVTVRWIFVVSHGIGEHSGRYEGFARWFAAHGARIFAFDYRGHGRSGGPRGDASSLEALLQDLDQVIALARQSGPGPLVLVGHSWGGLLAVAYALRQPDRIDRAVFSAPALKVRAEVASWKRALAQVLPIVLPRLTLANAVDPTVLSHDHAVVNAYTADPFVHNRISARLYAQTVARADTLIEQAPALRVPYLMLQGADDRLVDPGGSRRFHERATVAGRAMTVYPGLYHEIFNEPEQEHVFADIVAWLTELSARPPTGGRPPS